MPFMVRNAAHPSVSNNPRLYSRRHSILISWSEVNDIVVVLPWRELHRLWFNRLHRVGVRCKIDAFRCGVGIACDRLSSGNTCLTDMGGISLMPATLIGFEETTSSNITFLSSSPSEIDWWFMDHIHSSPFRKKTNALTVFKLNARIRSLILMWLHCKRNKYTLTLCGI